MGRQRSRGPASRVRITASPSVVSDGAVSVVVMQSVNLLPAATTYLHVVKHENGHGLHTVPLALVEAYEAAQRQVEDAMVAIEQYVMEHGQFAIPALVMGPWVTHAEPIPPPVDAEVTMPSLAEHPAEDAKTLLGLLDEPTGEHPVTVVQKYGTLNGLDSDPDQTRPLPTLDEEPAPTDR